MNHIELLELKQHRDHLLKVQQIDSELLQQTQERIERHSTQIRDLDLLILKEENK
ncbi:coil containing protein [Vibrio phage 1.115.B._10N.222.49.B11]|nr:coil containing protein [Vibrio phage 1.115.A._10N.222.49.B11]AUR88581.1 coil containing protein [Vibrio phage 1.115.B._10N.222.49.B11]